MPKFATASEHEILFNACTHFVRMKITIKFASFPENFCLVSFMVYTLFTTFLQLGVYSYVEFVMCTILPLRFVKGVNALESGLQYTYTPASVHCKCRQYNFQYGGIRWRGLTVT